MKPLQSVRSSARWLLIVLAICPALLTLWGILTCGVDVPLMDQWMPDIAGMFIKAHNGSLGFSDFWIQHNEHRIVVPRVIFYLLGRLTRWNVVAEMVAEWIAVCGTSAGILWLIVRATPGASPRLSMTGAFKWFVCNLLLFSLAQWENWLTGISLTNVLPMTFIVTAICVAQSTLNGWTRTGLAIALAWLAMFSAGTGVLAWPVVGLMLGWSESREELKAKKWMLCAFAAGMLLSVLIYLIGYHRPSQLPGQASAEGPTSLWSMIRFTLIFLGNAFCYTMPAPTSQMAIATGAGIVMLTLFAACAGYFVFMWRSGNRRDLLDRMLPWLAIAGCAIGAALTASFFRASHDVEQGRSSRYVSFSIYLPIGLVGLIPLVCGDLAARWGRNWDRVPVVSATILVLLLALRIPADVVNFQRLKHVRLERKAQLLLIKIIADRQRIAQELSFDPADLIAQAPMLDEIGHIRPRLIASSDARALSTGNADSAVFGATEQILQQNPGEIFVTGWAVLPYKFDCADAVFLTYENEQGQATIFAQARLGVQHDDVAGQQHSVMQYAGWVGSFNIRSLPANIRQFKISGWAMDAETGHAFRLAGEKTINVGR